MVIAFIKWNPFHHKIYKGDYDGGGEYNGYVAFDAELPKSWQGGMGFSFGVGDWGTFGNYTY